MSTARETQYQTDPKFNWNRILSLPFARELDIVRVTHFAVVGEEYTRFPDVSFYQGVIDFAIMANKAKGVIIRAGQGAWIDKQFERNYTEAKKNGLKRGVYWFFDDRISPRAQFENLKSMLDKHGLPEMEVWIDWENTYGGSHNNLKDVVALMQLIEAEYPTAVVGMYTGFYWFTEHSNPVSNYFQYRYLKERPLWLAWYGDITHVRIPAPWTWILHWQYGTPSIGIAMGAQSREIDMNVLLDPQNTWEELYGEDTTPPPPTDRMEVVITWQ